MTTTGVLRAKVAGQWVDIIGTTVDAGGGISQADADLRYVNVPGDTMTGQLVMGAPAGTEQIKITGATSYVGFWNGTTREGYIQGTVNGLYLSSDVGNIVIAAPSGFYLSVNGNGSHVMVGHLNLSGYNLNGINICESNGFNLYGNNSFYFATWGGGWYMTDATYIRATNSKIIYTAGQIRGDGGFQTGAAYMVTNYNDTDSGLYWWSDGHVGLVVNGLGVVSVYGTQVDVYNLSTISGYRIISNGAGYGGGWDQGGVIVQKAGWENRSSITYHIPGVWAGALGSTGYGGFGVWNNGSTGYESVGAAAFNVMSSRRFKQDIRKWEPARAVGAGAMSATNRLSLIDVVEYRQLREEALSVPTEDGGGEPHVCGEHCDGSEADPCPRVLDWENPHLGVIIEDLLTVLPEAVAMSDVGKPEMMRVGSMIGFLLSVCKEQQERIEMLEHQQEAA